MSVKITPADEKIEFLDNSGNLDAKISLDGSGNLKLENFNGGSMVLGDPTADIYVGDGSASVDIVYDVGGRLYSTANQHLTIGKSSLGGNDIVIDSPNWSVTDAGLLNLVANGTAGIAINFGGNASTYIYSSTSGSDMTIRADDDLILRGDDELYLQSGGTTTMTLLSEGRVGIGTLSPEDKLHISAGNLIFDTSGQQSESNFAAHSKILFRDEADSTTRTMAGIGAERTAWNNSPHDLVFYTGNLGGSSSEDFDESTEKLRITDTGSIKTPLGNINTCVVFGYNRTDMGSNAFSLKALVVESASTQNTWGYIMPKSGRVKMFTLRTNNHTVTGTNAQTWKINRNNQNGGTAGTDHFQIAVAKGATQNDTGVTGNATMELTATVHSSSIWKGSVVVNLAFAAGDEIRIQRTIANNVNMGDVSGQIFVEFD